MASLREARSGSPAHAGMVLGDASWSRRHTGFPRPRGDGPHPNLVAGVALGVPPPTRGWSPGPGIAIPPCDGSPTHAGMVRWPNASPGTASGFPRPRGDGPHPDLVANAALGVPPPTRGWSPGSGMATIPLCGSPAHAGMVPLARANVDDSVWFPRPRGDGPGRLWTIASRLLVPPPTRGWSRPVDSHLNSDWGSPAHAGMVRGEGDRPISLCGSPAHAGMVPAVSTVSDHAVRFPRPRGDGPIADLVARYGVWVPPPTRGWSLGPDAYRIDREGSPAHAGMVLWPPSWSPSAARFPRPRGDGPTRALPNSVFWWVPPPTRGWSGPAAAVRPLPRGSPAHAGMVPATATIADRPLGFPRPRGDGPLLFTEDQVRAMVPPPTRGWSRPLHGRDRRRRGSPAHAGMVRLRSRRRPGRPRFPRPRGDGPKW